MVKNVLLAHKGFPLVLNTKLEERQILTVYAPVKDLQILVVECYQLV